MGAFAEEDHLVKRLSADQIASVASSFPRSIIGGREFLVIDDMHFLLEDFELLGGFSGKIWTNSRVFFEFDQNVSAANQANFNAAAAEWSDVTNIIFQARTNQANYIHVQDGNENSSAVGMVGGRQDLTVTSWNNRFIIAHEIAHALGMVHEHTRGDRDQFVRINTNNIQQGREHNFQILNTSNYTRYDFASIMHYPANAFSTNQLPTIEPQPAFQAEGASMGNRAYMTSRDAASMNIRYGRP